MVRPAGPSRYGRIKGREASLVFVLFSILGAYPQSGCRGPTDKRVKNGGILMCNVKYVVVFLAATAFGGTVSAQTYAYVSNTMGNNVSVVNRSTNKVVTNISISAAGLSGAA